MGTFSRHADTVGDGTGATNANVDGSTTPVTFKITARGNENGLFIHRALIFVRDGGSFDSGAYGNGITMTGGIEIGVYYPDGTLKQDLLDGEPILRNVDWGRVCYDVQSHTFGSGDESLTARWTYSKAGQPIHLKSGRYLGITINDDLTSLNEQRFMLQGEIDE